MRIILISGDYQLYRTCRGVLDSARPGQAELIVSPRNGRFEGDVCIWDFEDGQEVPEAFLVFAGSRVLIVSKRQLESIPEDVCAGVHVVLRPASESTLRAFILPLEDASAASSRVHALSSDRDALLQLLLQANLKLQEYDHARSNFFARAAHDCRAPLTAISGYCDLLLTGQLGPLADEQLRVLTTMQSSIRRLTRLSSAMFQLNVVNRVERPADLTVHPVEPSVQEAVRQIAHEAEEKGIEVTVQLNRPSEPVAFEPFRIEQVLINLLENSCRFTPSDGRIEVRGYDYFWDRRKPVGGAFTAVQERRRRQVQRPNCYRIDICDNGPGVPAEHRHDIFEEYISYSAPAERAGSGLGLAISKMIVDHHGGAIWAADCDSGAVFSFVLPFHRSATSEAVRSAS